MTGRERILTALAHREPDHVPLDLNAAPNTGIHIDAYRRLREHLGLPRTADRIGHAIQRLAVVDDDILERLRVDTRQFPLNPSSNGRIEITEEDGSHVFTDEWGIGFRMPMASGYYFDPWIAPLASAETVRDVEHHSWPDPMDPARYAGLVAKAKELRRGTNAAITLGEFSGGVLDMTAMVRGLQQTLMDLASNSKVVHAIMEKVADLKCQFYETALPILGPHVDIVLDCDDIGGQDAPIISPRMYRQLIKPHHKRITDTIAAHTNAARYFHSCGSIYELIPDFIEVGVQILNPVQVSAARMDTKVLKREFGEDLVFWGGGCDTQHVLWRGSVGEIRDEVKRRIDDLAPGGGFVFTQVHNIQSGVPPGNMLAMWEACADYGGYGPFAG